MDDLTILRDAWGQPDPPAPAAYSAARAALLEWQAAPPNSAARGLGTVLLRGPVRGGAGGRSGGRRARRAAVAAVSVAAAAAVTVLAVQPTGGPGAGSGISVRELAYRTAAVAAAGPDVAPGQWVYWQEKQGGAWLQEKHGGNADIFQTWTTADARNAAYRYRGKVQLFRSGGCGKSGPGSARGCSFIGQPIPMTNAHPGFFLTTLAGPMAVSYAGLGSLPRNPLALDRYLGRLHLPGSGPAPVREFEIISDLLTSYVMPPALTAELYRSLGDITGVTVDHHAVDVAGRTGVGFQITQPKPAGYGGGTDELVINPHTYRLMGQQLLAAPASGAARHVLSGTAILRRVLVSGPGVRPSA